MPQLNATISHGLWQALLDYAERRQEPLAHIVSKALAEYLKCLLSATHINAHE